MAVYVPAGKHLPAYRAPGADLSPCRRAPPTREIPSSFQKPGCPDRQDPGKLRAPPDPARSGYGSRVPSQSVWVATTPVLVPEVPSQSV